MDELTEGRCARCGISLSHGRLLSPPPEWSDYLREERDVEPSLAERAIPLCVDCHAEGDLLTEDSLDARMAPDEEDVELAATVRSFLDELRPSLLGRPRED